jgi:hypothetical protein
VRYGYVCPDCGPVTSSERAAEIFCPRCLDLLDPESHEPQSIGRAKRDWRFHLDYSFQPYYAPSFGTVVNSRSHAKDLAKVASEEATRRLGYEHDFRVVDTHDDAAVGVDTAEKEAVKENTRRFAVNGAAWSKERLKEIADHKAENTKKRVNA